MPDDTETGRTLVTEPLTAEAFAPFGDVIDIASAQRRLTINEGFAERFDDVARIDTGRDGGRTRLSIFRARPRELPMALTVLERHRLGSQAFIPATAQPFLVVVCEGGDSPDLGTLRCFCVPPGQGVNYAAGTWHHPLLALQGASDFFVIDRGGPHDVPDCDDVRLPAGAVRITG